MNTFLPFNSFEWSASALDSVRLNKQVLECYQLMNTLAGRSRGYQFHPCTLMWEGYTAALGQYARACLDEYERRSQKTHALRSYVPAPANVPMPWWFGVSEFHTSHIRVLQWKDPTKYRLLGGGLAGRVAANSSVKPAYVWPVAASRWKVVDGKLYVLKSKWTFVSATKISRSRLTTPFDMGNNRAQYLLEDMES